MDEVTLISWTQKMVLYETKARFYIVGSNKSETRFRVLKIDRTEARELAIHDDKVEYSRNEIRSVLSMIDGGNKPKKQGNSIGLAKSISAFGIAGFVRFLEGYYMILITKRKKAAVIGPHTIYKVEDTSMLYIPNDSVRVQHPDESRYMKMFQNVDLSSNFYFSYSYDVTHNLQYNMAPVFADLQDVINTDKTHQQPQPNPFHIRTSSKLQSVWDGEEASGFDESIFPQGQERENPTDKEMEEHLAIPISDVTDLKQSPDATNTFIEKPKTGSKKEPVKCGVKNAPSRKFLWNNHLLKGFEDCVHSDWILYIIHGFVGQSNVRVYGKSVYLTVIGRRSNQFAGTRFLKRGTNLQGHVANEIETEQIVQDTSVTFLDQGKVSSFVQSRGSVPLFWSQDLSRRVPKPQIELDQTDPYSAAAGMHFNQLLCRYGAPVIVLNLVKTREHRRHESILSEDYIKTLDYLNQFLPAEHAIQYIGFDMARVNKRKDADVMLRLDRIARYCMKQTGFFLSVPPTQAQYLNKDPELQPLHGLWGPTGCRQRGLVRTNCVDCLDRTNTAQFAVGRSALAYQLYALGVLEKPNLEFDTDCVKMLEELYEDHGDILALQYGGSQLVHRIKSYRKIAPWTSHTRDIMQTLSRYYSNAFSDVEKQQAFNLFLGVFVPVEGQPNLWDLTTDYYLHNKVPLGKKLDTNHYCQWWDAEAEKCLPLPLDEVSKSQNVHAAVITAPQSDEHVNSFHEHYRPTELSAFDDMYQIYLSQSGWKHVPKNATDLSPFCVRQFYDLSLERGAESNPNISGKDSSSSLTSFGSEGSSESSDNSDGEGGVHISDSSSDDSQEDEGNYISFKDFFPSMATVYDTEITEPSTRDQKMYKRYVAIGQGTKEEASNEKTSWESYNLPIPSTESQAELQNLHTTSSDKLHRSDSSSVTAKKLPDGIDIYPISAFKLDSSFFVEPPPVSRQARDIYTTYVQRGQFGAGPVSEADRQAYVKYINKKYL